MTIAQIQTHLTGALEGSASNLTKRLLTLRLGVSCMHQAVGHITAQSHA